MCGRYATTADPASLAIELDALDEVTGIDGDGASGASGGPDSGAPNYGAPNYNVAPTDEVLTVVRRHSRSDPDSDAIRRIRQMRWGFVASWAKSVGDGPPLFNARAESVGSKPTFRNAVKSKRCLVPMDGWFEWQKRAGGSSKPRKIPFYVTPADGSRLYVAGLWSVWHDRNGGPEQRPLLSCSILTTDSVGELRQIHDRMPLMMPAEDWDRWLDPDHPASADLLSPPDESVVAGLELRQVSQLVNSVRNSGPQLVLPDSAADALRVGEQITLL